MKDSTTVQSGSSWFDVDRLGLGRVVERRGKEFALFELIQNSIDAGSKSVKVDLKSMDRNCASLVVEDDAPKGFVSLRHAYTLFADSPKGTNPELRGRFDFGEKLVLSLCDEAEIISTTGAIRFSKDGKRFFQKGAKRAAGTIFIAHIRMTKAEVDKAVLAAHTIIVPVNVEISVNGSRISPRVSLAQFRTMLPTEIADEDGNLRRRVRTTDVKLYNVNQGETASLYELGIPVCETGDRYHYDVMQRIPLSLDRDSVNGPYLRAIRAEALSVAIPTLSSEDVRKHWVSEAIGAPSVEPAAVKAVINIRFGDNAVAADPSDREGEKLSASQGRQVVHGGSFSSEQWQNIRKAGALPAAGQVTPSPGKLETEGVYKTIPEDKWTPSMQAVALYSERIAKHLIDRDITVRFTADQGARFQAAFGPIAATLTFNHFHLPGGKDWYDAAEETIDSMLLHELAHEYSGDHLDEKYHDALCDLGARLRSCQARLLIARGEVGHAA
jgi:hypothetical protein